MTHLKRALKRFIDQFRPKVTVVTHKRIKASDKAKERVTRDLAASAPEHIRDRLKQAGMV